MKLTRLRPISQKRAAQLEAEGKRSYSTLERSSRINPVRPTLRRGELTAEQKYEIRQQVYDRAEGRCEIEIGGVRCGKFAPWVGDDFTRGQLVHIRGGAHREWTLTNLLWGCPRCHLDYLHNASGHPCPRPDGTRDRPLPGGEA